VEGVPKALLVAPSFKRVITMRRGIIASDVEEGKYHEA
jgi:hypothetical protein